MELSFQWLKEIKQKKVDYIYRNLECDKCCRQKTNLGKVKIMPENRERIANLNRAIKEDLTEKVTIVNKP